MEVVRIELIDGKISAEVSFINKDAVLLIPGARWSGTSGTWELPLSWATCKALRGVFGDRLVVGDALTKWAREEFDLRIAPSLALKQATDAFGEPLLRSYQRTLVKMCHRAEHLLIGDEQGTGKTPAAIVALRELGEEGLPALVVCTNSMKWTWVDEFERWYPDARVTPVYGSKAKRVEAIESVQGGRNDVCVINWESLRIHSRVQHYGNVRLSEGERDPKELNAVPWKTVIVDEIHRAKEPSAKQTRAAWYIAHQPTVRWRWGLTGTPIADTIEDLWSIMHLLAPDEYPVKSTFIDRYALLGWSLFGSLNVIGIRPDTKDEFFSFFDPRFRRVIKAVVLPELPPKVYQRRYVDMSPKQAKAYEQMRKLMVAELDSGLLTTANALAKMTRLIQFSSAYAELDEEGQVLLQEPSSKLDALEDLLDEYEGKPLVVVAVHRQLVDMAARRLEKRRVAYRVLTGAVPPDERKAAIDDFQAGRAQVFLFTIKAGGEGITLTAADTIVFLQRSWSMLENRQAEDRVHRIGAEDHERINVIDVVSRHTVEKRQIDVIQAKAERFEELVRDRDALEDSLRRET